MSDYDTPPEPTPEEAEAQKSEKAEAIAEVKERIEIIEKEMELWHGKFMNWNDSFAQRQAIDREHSVHRLKAKLIHLLDEDTIVKAARHSILAMLAFLLTFSSAWAQSAIVLPSPGAPSVPTDPCFGVGAATRVISNETVTTRKEDLKDLLDAAEVLRGFATDNGDVEVSDAIYRLSPALMMRYEAALIEKREKAIEEASKTLAKYRELYQIK